MALSDDMELLSAVPLFQGLDGDQLRLIAFGAEHRLVSAGQALFREKTPAECAYVIARGQFELSLLARGGKPRIEAIADRGTMLSELALATMVERKFTAIALEDSDVIRITRALFHRLLEEYPDMAEVVGDRIRDNIAALAEGAEAMKHRFG
ncbi:MAG: cyclic nucleotide-binding domain-containing protein [Allorhizobium sp.]